MNTIKDTLTDALKMTNEEGSFKSGRKVLILALDDSGDNYSISFVQCGMKASECIALCEVSKTVFLSEMNYI